MSRHTILLTGGALAAIIALASPASAGPPAVFDNQYEGRAERDPNTYVGFDVIRNGGVKKVGKVGALLSYHCTNGVGGDAAGRVKGRLRVEDDRFAGTLRGNPLLARAAPARGPGPSRIKYHVSGELLRNGKAKGTIDATLKFTPTRAHGNGLVRCYTGGLDWKAKRGADVPVVP